MKGGKNSFNPTGNQETPIIIMVLVKLANKYLPSAKRAFVSAFLSGLKQGSFLPAAVFQAAQLPAEEKLPCQDNIL